MKQFNVFVTVGRLMNLPNSFQIKGMNIPWVYELAINIFIKAKGSIQSYAIFLDNIQGHLL